MLVLDTDLLSILHRGPARDRARLLERLDRAQDEEVAVTIISFEEQMRGWLAVIAKAKSAEHQAVAYARLGNLLFQYSEHPVLPFDVPAAHKFAELRRQYRRLGAADLKIAAIALGNRATLLTRNVRDFHGIDGLPIENPCN